MSTCSAPSGTKASSSEGTTAMRVTATTTNKMAPRVKPSASELALDEAAGLLLVVGHVDRRDDVAHTARGAPQRKRQRDDQAEAERLLGLGGDRLHLLGDDRGRVRGQRVGDGLRLLGHRLRGRRRGRRSSPRRSWRGRARGTSRRRRPRRAAGTWSTFDSAQARLVTWSHPLAGISLGFSAAAPGYSRSSALACFDMSHRVPRGEPRLTPLWPVPHPRDDYQGMQGNCRFPW